MKNKSSLIVLLITVVAIAFAVVPVFTGCASKESKKASSNAEIPFEKSASLASLAEKYNFKVGACIAYDTVANKNYTEMIKGDFNTITACNEFKAYSLLNQTASQTQNRPVMNYKMADKIASFAQANGIGIRGHVLVWDAYMSDWFFRENFARDGAFVGKEVMEERLKYYIKEVITHFETNFPGVVYCWDVVNEAVADGANEQVPGNPYHLRKTRGGSSNIFYEIMGEDYVWYAFKCARDVVNELGCDVKLFYNDYNTFYPDKRDAITRLVQFLNKEERLCDGVGMQGYIGGYGQQNGCMNPGDLTLIKQAINQYSRLGVEVQLTEVAVRNYNGDEAVMKRHAEFYGELFRSLIGVVNSGANFTGITIWGICDNPIMDRSDYSYKQNGPYCGLFTKYFQPKDSYKEVYRVLE